MSSGTIALVILVVISLFVAFAVIWSTGRKRK